MRNDMVILNFNGNLKAYVKGQLMCQVLKRKNKTHRSNLMLAAASNAMEAV